MNDDADRATGLGRNAAGFEGEARDRGGWAFAAAGETAGWHLVKNGKVEVVKEGNIESGLLLASLLNGWMDAIERRIELIDSLLGRYINGMGMIDPSQNQL